jgi:hypothetical protein
MLLFTHSSTVAWVNWPTRYSIAVSDPPFKPSFSSHTGYYEYLKRFK